MTVKTKVQSGINKNVLKMVSILIWLRDLVYALLYNTIGIKSHYDNSKAIYCKGTKYTVIHHTANLRVPKNT